MFDHILPTFRTVVSVHSAEGDKATLQEPSRWLRVERLPVLKEITGAENQTYR